MNLILKYDHEMKAVSRDVVCFFTILKNEVCMRFLSNLMMHALRFEKYNIFANFRNTKCR